MPTKTTASEPNRERPSFPGLGPRDAQKRLESCGLQVLALSGTSPTTAS
jgi:hypothetical protein